MSALLWFALVLVALWFVVKVIFKVVGGFIHLLLVIAVIAIAYSFLK